MIIRLIIGCLWQFLHATMVILLTMVIQEKKENKYIRSNDNDKCDCELLMMSNKVVLMMMMMMK